MQPLDESSMKVSGVNADDLLTGALSQSHLYSPHKCFLEWTTGGPGADLCLCCFLVQAPVESKRVPRIPWNWSHEQSNPGPLQGQEALLPAEPSSEL